MYCFLTKQPSLVHIVYTLKREVFAANNALSSSLPEIAEFVLLYITTKTPWMLPRLQCLFTDVVVKS